MTGKPLLAASTSGSGHSLPRGMRTIKAQSPSRVVVSPTRDTRAPDTAFCASRNAAGGSGSFGGPGMCTSSGFVTSEFYLHGECLKFLADAADVAGGRGRAVAGEEQRNGAAAGALED